MNQKSLEGKPAELLKKYSMEVKNIISAAKKANKRKRK